TATPLLMECDIAALMLAGCGSWEWWMSTRLQRRASSALKPSHGLRGSTGMGSWESGDMRDRPSRAGGPDRSLPGLLARARSSPGAPGRRRVAVWPARYRWPQLENVSDRLARGSDAT